MALGTEKIAETFLNIVVNTPIDCDWPLYAEDEVEVVYGSASLLAVLNTDFTVTLSGPNYDQFQITPLASLLTKINNLIVADPTNEINYITVRRVLDYKTSVTPESVRGVAFLSREVERIHMRFQQLSEVVTRCVRFPRKEVGDDESDPTLPGKDLRANKAAIFDANGNVTVSEDDYEDQAASAAASAGTASAQAALASASATSAQAALDSIEDIIEEVAKNLDVFLIIGQSNAGGRGDKTTAPITVPVGKCLRWYDGGSVADANDPIQPGETQTLAANFSNGGSAWPAFCLKYYEATGRKVGVIMSAKGGSAQVAAADSGNGNYDTSGLLYDAAVDAVTNGMNAFIGAGHLPSLKGIIIVNGETDALAINATTITGSDYITASQTMIANFRTDLGIPQLPVYYVKTGVYLEGDDSGFATIRAAQETIAAADPYTHIAYRGNVDTVWRGLYSSGTHFTQAGYNEMGAFTAVGVITGGARDTFLRDGSNAYLSGGYALVRADTNSKTAAPAAKTGQRFQGLSDDGNNTISVLDAVGVAAPIFLGRRAKGTLANKTGVVSGDVLALFGGEGYDSTGAYPGANDAPLGSIAILATETWSGTAKGTRIGFYATPKGSTSLAQIGTLSPALNASGAVRELSGVVDAQHTGDTNNSSSGSGADYTHNLTFAVPANYLIENKLLRVTALWKMSTGSGAPTIIHKLKMGSTVVADCGATTPNNNISAQTYATSWIMQATSAPGASGTVNSTLVAAPNSPVAETVRNTVSQPVTLATNGALTLSVASRWSAAGTGTNTIQLIGFIVEAVN